MLGYIDIRLKVVMPPDTQSTTLKDLLTKKELTVTKLVAAGYSNPEIADKLGIKYGTVVGHVARAFIKLHCKNRVQLAAKYLLEDRPSA